MFSAPISRRALLTRGLLLLAPTLVRGKGKALPPSARIAALEAASGARIGVAAVDTGSGRTFFHRERERFLFCSTWKFLVVSALLARVDRGQENLARRVSIHRGDLVPHSPATGPHAGGQMTLASLCAAAITVSDNAASNLLLAAIGGLPAFNHYLRSIGDSVAHLDRVEPELNAPDGDKDTTSPLAMVEDMKRILVGDALKPASRRKLLNWLDANTTGAQMLRAGLPAHWKIGDKTGHGDNASNDVAIITPPWRAPILVAVYTMYPRGVEPKATVVPEIGRIVEKAFAN